jgi:hypothetical protein
MIVSRTMRWYAACAWIALAAIACGSKTMEGVPPASNANDAGVAIDDHPDAAPAIADIPGFTADRRGTGPRLWIDAKVDGGRTAQLELWAADLGPVFGYSAHLRFDDGHLALAAGTAPPASATVLGQDDPAKAIELWTQGSGDVGFGAVRRSPEAGEVPIVDATKLGALTLEASRAGRSALTLDRAIVRRADGSFVPVTVSGGTLVTVEGGGS